MADVKRARVEVQSFTEVRVEDLKLKALDLTTDSGSPFVIPLGLASFNLTPTGWLCTRYGFDLNSKYGKPSFLGGEKPKNAKSESLAMRVSLDATTAAFLKEVDEKASEEYKKLHDVPWQPLVIEDLLFNGGSSVKVHVVLAGSPLTKLTVVDEQKVDRGEGWEFVKTYLDRKASIFNNADVKVCLRVNSVWCKDGKAGISLTATRLVLRPMAEVDPFGDDAELLA
jgi:hypothetical protein